VVQKHQKISQKPAFGKEHPVQIAQTASPSESVTMVEEYRSTWKRGSAEDQSSGSSKAHCRELNPQAGLHFVPRREEHKIEIGLFHRAHAVRGGGGGGKTFGAIVCPKVA